MYERTGGHAYGSVYPGPIGAVLSPQLTGVADNASLPFASTLCGACYDVCPVAIDIPQMLVHLRSRVVDSKREASRAPTPEQAADGGGRLDHGQPGPLAGRAAGGPAGPAAGRAARQDRHPAAAAVGLDRRPGTSPCRPAQPFRDWWAKRERDRRRRS